LVPPNKPPPDRAGCGVDVPKRPPVCVDYDVPPNKPPPVCVDCDAPPNRPPPVWFDCVVPPKRPSEACGCEEADELLVIIALKVTLFCRVTDLT